MPWFSKNATNTAYNNYTDKTIEIPKNIGANKSIDGTRPNIIIPSFVVSLSQSIITFFLKKTSKLPIIGTKNGEVRKFIIDEFHILCLISMGFSIHYWRKYRKLCDEYEMELNKLMIESKLHNFSTLAAVDHNNIKRIECVYYKTQFQFYDIDLLTRTEMRSFIQQTLQQCELLSSLTIKILETVNSCFKKQRKSQLLSLYESKLNKNNNNLRSNSMQQRLKIELRNKQNSIDEYFDRQEETVDKFQSFFDEKNNEQHLIETRDQQRDITEKEILDGYKDQNEQKQIEINAKKFKENVNDITDDSKMTEQDDIIGETNFNQNEKHHGQQRNKLLNLNYDHEYLIKQADNLPIQQIDFSCKEISRYNLQKEVNQMKYDIILNQNKEKRTEQIRKYGMITLIVTTTAFTYWYNRHYHGKGVTQRIRDTRARLFSYF